MSASVLLVGDPASGIARIERRLTDEFFDTVTAGGAIAALALVRSEGPDVVLIGGTLADGNSLELCRRLKSSDATAHLPVMMVGSVGEPAARLRGLAAGADDVIEAAEAAELFARVRSLVRLKRLLDEIRAREADGGLVAAGIEAGIDTRVATIAIVDDGGAHVADVMGMARGFGTVVTVPIATALDRLRSLPCDLVIVGLAAGRVDGLRLVARIRSHRETRSLPVLAVVDTAGDAALVRGFELGVDDCVRLPAGLLEVTARARTLLRRRLLAERLRANLHLSMRLATTDAVTGVHNRHYLAQHLAGAVARAHAQGRRLAVAMIDVDHFKSVNDRFGHPVGDRALRALAERIATNVRGIDLVARYGGEEFAVVMPEADLDAAEAMAERVRGAVSTQPFDLGEPSDLPLSVSIGVAALVADDDAGSLLARADGALYAAKNGGRDRVVRAERAAGGGGSAQGARIAPAAS